MKNLPPIISAIISGLAAILVMLAAYAITTDTTQPAAPCCTPRVQTVKAAGTTWLCLIEEDTNGVERHRSCQMVNMSEHVE